MLSLQTVPSIRVLVGMAATKNMTFKAALLSNSFLHTLQCRSSSVPCRFRLIEHGLNWINHILHVGALGLLNLLEYDAAKRSACLVGETDSDANPA